MAESSWQSIKGLVEGFEENYSENSADKTTLAQYFGLIGKELLPWIGSQNEPWAAEVIAWKEKPHSMFNALVQHFPKASIEKNNAASESQDRLLKSSAQMFPRSLPGEGTKNKEYWTRVFRFFQTQVMIWELSEGMKHMQSDISTAANLIAGESDRSNWDNLEIIAGAVGVNSIDDMTPRQLLARLAGKIGFEQLKAKMSRAVDIKPLSKVQLKAFKFICRNGPVVGREVAEYMGITVSSFNSRYVPALKSHGIRNNDDKKGYFHPDHWNES